MNIKSQWPLALSTIYHPTPGNYWLLLCIGMKITENICLVIIMSDNHTVAEWETKQINFERNMFCNIKLKTLKRGLPPVNMSGDTRCQRYGLGLYEKKG